MASAAVRLFPSAVLCVMSLQSVLPGMEVSLALFTLFSVFTNVLSVLSPAVCSLPRNKMIVSIIKAGEPGNQYS